MKRTVISRKAAIGAGGMIIDLDQEAKKRVFLLTPGECEMKLGDHDPLWHTTEGKRAVGGIEFPWGGQEVKVVLGTARRFRQALSYLADHNALSGPEGLGPKGIDSLVALYTPLCGGPEGFWQRRVQLADMYLVERERYAGISNIGPETAWALVDQWLRLTTGDLLICADEEFLKALGWGQLYKPAALYRLNAYHNCVEKIS